MKEIMFQPKEEIKIKGRLIGIYIQDEKKWFSEHTQKETDMMEEIRAETLLVRCDPERLNYKCYIDYDKEMNETSIHIIIKEERTNEKGNN